MLIMDQVIAMTGDFSASRWKDWVLRLITSGAPQKASRSQRCETTPTLVLHTKKVPEGTEKLRFTQNFSIPMQFLPREVYA